MKGLRISVGVRVLGLLLALAAGLSPASGGVTRPAGLHSDFDGDGYADLVVSAQFEDMGSEAGAGVVQVLF
jgi:hypothetical protein